MESSLVVFMFSCVALLLVLGAMRRSFARRGHGRLAQLEFRRRNGERVAELLDGALDPLRGSPWIAIRIDGRSARMVAAAIGGGDLQAGIELLEHDLAMDVFHTTGDRDELSVPDGVDLAAVAAVAAQLAATGVENVARPHPGAPHILRVRFRSVEELPAVLAAVAPLLEQLERLGSAQLPNG